LQQMKQLPGQSPEGAAHGQRQGGAPQTPQTGTYL